MPLALNSEVKYLKGVGPQRAAELAKRGIETVGDLLEYFPFRYEDRVRFTPINQLVPGQVYSVLAEVMTGAAVRFARGRNAVFHLRVRDATGTLYGKFFHSGYLEGRFKPGQRLVLYGKVEIDRYRPARLEMINPQYEMLDSGEADSTEVGRIVPIYEAIGTLSSRALRRLIYSALPQLALLIPDPLPAEIVERYRYPARAAALTAAHFPAPEAKLEELNSFRTPAQQRLIFEEFFFYQLGLALRRREHMSRTGIAFRVREDRVREALKRVLPFKPTAAQKRVLAEIAADLERPAPMNRLLQGDVGSGKTIVAIEAATIAIENGCQASLMAPTEILAVQHYLSAKHIFARAGYRVELLISALKPAEKKAARERIRTGDAQLVIGTHALVEEPVEFARLGLAIVDEQHRFGVLQRKQLIEKGAEPHVLVMTATPIPRTLALTLYGDLDVSVLDEMPPGRAAVATRWTSDAKLAAVWEQVRREVRAGRQAFIIYPVIEESKQELKAATAEYERLAKQVFPELRLGLLHGRLPSEEKESVMERFRKGELDVLVSTTVIEVGVDVPNATVMVVEHADRFGLSQLHQLRGRIGRGAHPSTCILVAPAKIGEEARQRLEIMCGTNNGFTIAEKDLELRGPGEFFGTRQHGDVAFHLAHPLRDREFLELARREAFALVDSPERGETVEKLVAHLGRPWQQRYKLARVG